MKVEVTQIEELVRELSIEIPAEKVNDTMEQLFMEKRRSVTLKGFRKGKAPLDMIKSIYADQVKSEAVDNLIKETYSAAIREKTLRVASPPTLTDLKLTDEGTLKYTAKVEVMPKLEKVIFDNLEISTLETEATDEEVNEVVEQFRKQFSSLREVEREAEEGDIVFVDLTKIADPNMVMEASEFLNSEIDLGNPVTVKEFREQILGMKAKDEKEIKVVYDSDYSDARLAGAHITYLCRVNAVKERILPELNDPFAKSTGRAETLLELKLKLREDVGQHKQEVLKKAQRRELVRIICEKNPVPIPTGMIDEYVQAVAEDIAKSNPEVDQEEIKKNYRPIGENSMRWNLLWNRLAEQEEIEVLPADTEKWIEGFAQANNVPAQKATEMLNSSGKLRNLRESMLEEKVMDYLLEKAKLVHRKN